MKYFILALLLLPSCGQEYDMYSYEQNILIEIEANEVQDTVNYSYVEVSHGHKVKHYKKPKRHGHKK